MADHKKNTGHNSDHEEESFHKRVKAATGFSDEDVPDKFGGLKNAGREETDYSTDSIKSSKSQKTKTRYTNVTIDRKSFPYIANKDIGEKCLVICEIRKISESMPDFYDTDKDEKITIEILNIAEPKESEKA